MLAMKFLLIFFLLQQETELKTSKMSNNKKDEENEKGLTSVLEHIAFGSAKKVTGATNTAGNLVSDIYGSVVPDVLPDMKQIDEMVAVATISAYSLIAFGVTGTLFYTLRTVRELGQWRAWYRFRRTFKMANKTKKPESK
uniref:Uncharacterized protein n=1 Tax=Clytia hemisphaerica TaxID=252671 RepID=A0A7M5WLD7_9CNID|eukprot:TCONS_00006979-protein